MVKILREADRSSVPEVAKRHGISDQTIYAWRKRFGELEPADVKRLRQLAQENARLKKLVVERDLEIEVMREVARKKWWAPPSGDSRWSTYADAVFRRGERAGCSRWRARRCGTSPFSRSATRR
jgi:putative transposase